MENKPIREIVIRADRKGRSRSDLREMWEYRDLLLLLARRDVAVRYRQAFLGFAWAVLQPLATIAIFSVVFGRLVGVPSDGVPYPVFALSGILMWNFFSSALRNASESVVGNSSMVTKVYFPRLAIPVAALGAPSIDFAVATTLMIPMMGIYGLWPAWTALALPILFLLSAIVALGVGCFVSALTVSYRDFRHMMPFTIQFWMYATPIIYPPTLIPEAWRPLLYLNPMAGIIDGARSAWFGQPFDWAGLALSLASGLVLLWAGIRYFRVAERGFADVV